MLMPFEFVVWKLHKPCLCNVLSCRYVELVEGCKVIEQSHDQDTTDLHKCVLYINDSARESLKSDLCILVTGALGGRFDHEAGNINVLYRFSTMRIIFLSEDCLIHLLPRSHHHKIHIQPSIVGSHCGLVPIGVPSGRSTTTGLQWNLRVPGKYQRTTDTDHSSLHTPACLIVHVSQ